LHARVLACVVRIVPQASGKGGIVVMNLCGRGDKDIFTIANALGAKI
jgi:tryptophan synthase beta chain